MCRIGDVGVWDFWEARKCISHGGLVIDCGVGKSES